MAVVRAPKVLDIALFDLAATALLGYYAWRTRLWPTTLWPFDSVMGAICGTYALGIVIHWALGVHTMLGYYMGLNPRPRR